MALYTIELTDEENVAMSTICGDTLEWATNAVKERARIAIEDIVRVSQQKAMEAQVALPPTRPEIVQLAITNGWVAQAQAIPTAIVPSAVTMRQARRALLAIGKLDGITTAINALPSPQKEEALIEWEYSSEVQRHNGFVSVLAPSLGLTEEALDQLFIDAAKL